MNCFKEIFNYYIHLHIIQFYNNHIYDLLWSLGIIYRNKMQIGVLFILKNEPYSLINFVIITTNILNNLKFVNNIVV